jgi:predicted Ser/Thr protein kinase
MGSGPKPVPPRPPSSVGRLVSSGSLDLGAFPPGAMLGERYRVVGLLGKGGMGEVYRADDLKLGQAVALKFLPKAVSGDESLLARFHAEVRLARQVSHPNVCRIYDIGEIEGRHFLSMEYVDGEDLASLLKRIGHLPVDKTVDIARQLCAGLHAAHEKGVLHRDLKPANVMLDGRGRVRITDFGLAVAAEEAANVGEISGTPAYMAPEQLAGKPASVRSDLYALGLVLYEVATGKRAFDAPTLAEMKRKHEQETPTAPSNVLAGFDPAVERVILRCLEKDPRARPSSAVQVAGALPGGDPLAAALAAGETPSPEMVAAAGEEGALAPAKAGALLAGVALAVAALFVLAPYASDLGLAPLPKSPDSLTDRAREITVKLGYDRPPADSEGWLQRDVDYMTWRTRNVPWPERVHGLGAAQPSAYLFIYRQSPRPMAPQGEPPVVTLAEPPYEVSEMVTVTLDPTGRLRALRAVPPQVEPAPQTPRTPDWRTLFSEAGLDISAFAPATDPAWLSPSPFDARSAWTGRLPGGDRDVQVLAAAYHGRPVSFEIVGPWSSPLRMGARPRTVMGRLGSFMRPALFAFAIVLGIVFARRNLRLGRGDRRGAFRLFVFTFAVALAERTLRTHHVADVGGEWNNFFNGLSYVLLASGFVWLTYLALEPYVRRRWPELLISWSRLLAGRFRDSLVGRDVLAGSLLGAACALNLMASQAIPWFTSVPGETPLRTQSYTLRGTRHLFAGFFDAQVLTLLLGLLILTLLTLSHLALKRRWLAVLVTAVAIVVVNGGGENPSLEVPFAALYAALLMTAALRTGVLGLVVTLFLGAILIDGPLTFDASRWYASHGWFLVAVSLAIAAWGFHTSLGARPLFGAAGLDD